MQRDNPLHKEQFHISDIAGTPPLYLAKCNAVKVKVEGIDLSVAIDPQVHQTYIPPFTLQLLVENCIKHNVVSLERPLQVKVYSEGEYIVVQNQIQLKRTPEASTGMGLENINQRYTHMLDKKIIIEPTEQFFTVKLPVINENSHY